MKIRAFPRLTATRTATRAALTTYKARGGKLGAARPEVPKLTAEARVGGARAASVTARVKAHARLRRPGDVPC